MPPKGLDDNREKGSASVEFVATVPFLLLAILVAAQIAIAGQALWSAAVASRAGARAAVVGRDAAAAARRALPDSLRDGAEVDAAGPVIVRVAVPRLLPLLPSLDVSAESALKQGGG